MIQNFKNWWNKDKLAMASSIKRIEDGLQAERVEKAQLLLDMAKLQYSETTLQQELSSATAELDVIRSKEEADLARRNGAEPWVEIKSADFNEVKGIQIELDWNEAFVQYLKDNGVKARTDDQIVQKWLATLYADMVEKLESKIIDDSDKPRINDFE